MDPSNIQGFWGVLTYMSSVVMFIWGKQNIKLYNENGAFVVEILLI